MAPRFLLALLLASTAIRPQSTAAQAQSPAKGEVELTGLLYSDYSYVLETRDGSRPGENGFGYRRLYLTADFERSSALSFRVRLETTDGGTNSLGRPSPFVKDLYVRWKDAFADGHEIFFGISAPPGWEVSERFFGYRSLDATIMDRVKIASSRDFGVRVTGPVSGSIRYNVMVGNNNSVNPEDNRFKRLYGQLELRPAGRFIATIGADRAARVDGSTTTVNAFAGYDLDPVRVGAEVFLSPVRVDAPAEDVDRGGVSLFAAAKAGPKLEVVMRYDNFYTDTAGTRRNGWLGLAGLAWSPRQHLTLIPNLVFDRAPADEAAQITGRFTVHLDF